MNKKLNILKDLYKLYGKYADSLNYACREACSTCCTRNMTLTSLEALYLIERTDQSIVSDVMSKIKLVNEDISYSPKLTLNQVAERYLEARDIPEEENDPAWGMCPVLRENLCPIYNHRPFGCRCMMSTGNCGELGFADMDPFSITVSHMFLQYIEHLDRTGIFGNFSTMMVFFSNTEKRELYWKDELKYIENSDLLPNHSMRLLLVPPEHQVRIRPLLNSIQEIFGKHELGLREQECL